MSFTSGINRPLAQIKAGQSIKNYNLAAALANTEYSQALSPATKRIIISILSGRANWKIGWSAGETNTKPFTIPKGNSLELDSLDFSGIIYVQTDKPSQTIQIIEVT